MNRLRWYNIEWKLGLSDLRDLLLRSRYSAQVPSGFILDKVGPDFLEARYIERLEVTEDLIAPDGEKYSQRVIYFDTIDFLYDHAREWVEVVDAPRKTGALLNKIAAISGFDSIIEPRSIDIDRFVELCGADLGPTIVGEIYQSGHLSGAKVSIKLLMSGETDVREAPSAILGVEERRTERVKLRVTTSSGTHGLEVTQSGCVKFSRSTVSDELLLKLRAIISKS